jgi:hypothetical protein
MTETPCSRCGQPWPDGSYWFVLLESGHGTPVCRDCITTVEVAESIVNNAYVGELDRSPEIHEFAGWYEIERRAPQ